MLEGAFGTLTPEFECIKACKRISVSLLLTLFNTFEPTSKCQANKSLVIFRMFPIPFNFIVWCTVLEIETPKRGVWDQLAKTSDYDYCL